MDRIKKIAIFRLVASLLAFVAIIFAFQNCAKNGDSSSGEEIPGARIEINTTKATSIRNEGNISTASGSQFEILAYAEDVNGDVVTDFNYTAQLYLDPPPNLDSYYIEVCKTEYKFENGILRAQLSVVNNTGNDITVSIKVSSVGLPSVTHATASIPGFPESPFSEVGVVSAASPSPRENFAIALDSIRERILLFGGRELIEAPGGVQQGTSLGDLWELDISSPSAPIWRELEISSSKPSSRYGHTLAYDREKSRLLLFGGTQSNGTGLNDLWAFDLETDEWERLNPSNTPPPGQFNHDMAFDSSTGYMTVVRGQPGIYSQPYNYRGHGLGDGNWIPTGEFPTTPSSNIPIIYLAGTPRVLNPFHPKRIPTLTMPDCVSHSLPFGCYNPGRAIVIDETNKALWSIVPISGYGKYTPGIPYLTYDASLKVLRKSLPVKSKCTP